MVLDITNEVEVLLSAGFLQPIPSRNQGIAVNVVTFYVTNVHIKVHINTVKLEEHW